MKRWPNKLQSTNGAGPAGGAPPPRGRQPATRRFTDSYLPYLLAQASALACAEFQGSLRAASLGGLAWRMLATLSDERALTIGKLSRIVLAQQPHVTQVATQLERKGWVARRQPEHDRRQTRVTITKTGRRRVFSLLEEARRREKFALEALSAEELGTLKSLLRKMVLGALARELAKIGDTS